MHDFYISFLIVVHMVDAERLQLTGLPWENSLHEKLFNAAVDIHVTDVAFVV